MNTQPIGQEDWERLKARIKGSKFRARFKLREKEIRFIGRKGMEVVQAHAYEFVRNRIAPATPPKEGKQTPMRSHPVFVSQHATATCCRGCMSKWHGIEPGRPLTDGEIDYVVSVILAWIEDHKAKIQAIANVGSTGNPDFVYTRPPKARYDRGGSRPRRSNGGGDRKPEQGQQPSAQQAQPQLPPRPQQTQPYTQPPVQQPSAQQAQPQLPPRPQQTQPNTQSPEQQPFRRIEPAQVEEVNGNVAPPPAPVKKICRAAPPPAPPHKIDSGYQRKPPIIDSRRPPIIDSRNPGAYLGPGNPSGQGGARRPTIGYGPRRFMRRQDRVALARKADPTNAKWDNIGNRKPLSRQAGTGDDNIGNRRPADRGIYNRPDESGMHRSQSPLKNGQIPDFDGEQG